ncbi:hypothetical protein BgiMline_024711 [Biomphalaria glabrata]|nr:hypothetical protein BgiMline_007887 [Biomphalaria glabrata]
MAFKYQVMGITASVDQNTNHTTSEDDLEDGNAEVDIHVIAIENNAVASSVEQWNDLTEELLLTLDTHLTNSELRGRLPSYVDFNSTRVRHRSSPLYVQLAAYVDFSSQGPTHPVSPTAPANSFSSDRSLSVLLFLLSYFFVPAATLIQLIMAGACNSRGQSAPW